MYGVGEAIWALLNAVLVVTIFYVGYWLGDTIPRISKQYLMLRILGIVAFATLLAFLVLGTLGTRMEGEQSVRVWYPTDTERTTIAVKSWLMIAVPSIVGLAYGLNKKAARGDGP